MTAAATAHPAQSPASPVRDALAQLPCGRLELPNGVSHFLGFA